MENSTVVIQGTANLTENSITEFGFGGAISAHSSNLSLNATVIFFNNSAGYGGAIYAEVSHVQLASDVTFENNQAFIGGAIHTVGGSVLITGNSSFVSNGAGEGGAMKLEGSTQLVLRSPLVASFYYNEADCFGGAIFNDDSASVCSDSQQDCFFAEDPNSDQRELYT